MIADAIHGLLADDDFCKAARAAPAQPARERVLLRRHLNDGHWELMRDIYGRLHGYEYAWATIERIAP